MSRAAKIWAIMPAAGVGLRMQLDFPKQYLKVGDKTVLEHSIDALLNLQSLEQLVVCISADDNLFEELQIRDPRVVTVEGGTERADSVLNGLNALAQVAEPNDWVLVHDAARPCLAANDLHNLVSNLVDDPVGGILATRARDTLKLSESSGGTNHVLQTLDREQIWQAETPQMFRFGLLLQAMREGLENDKTITDEASAMELADHSVKLVESKYPNLKVTSPQDQKIAEFLLTPR